MSHETPTSHRNLRLSPESKFYLKAAALIGPMALGVAAIASDKEPHHETPPVVQVHVNGAAEFGGSADDWEHGTAERLIKALIDKGVAKAATKLGEDGLSAEVRKSAEELPIYAQANIALEKAENGTIPDEGDLITIGIDLNVNSNDTVTYVVTDATITDKPNNQE